MMRDSGLLFGFGLASGAAVAIGAVVCVLAAAPTSAWMLTVGGWVAGAAIAWGLARTAHSPALLNAMVVVGLVACALPLILGPELDGVRRWLQLGPMTLNAALLTAPAMIVALGLSGGWRWAAAPAVAILLALQPDASQATAFACAVGVAGLLSPLRRDVAMALWATTGVAAALAWIRPDPLLPVAHVEQIIPLAWSVLPPLAVAAVASSLAVVASLALFATRHRPTRIAAAAVATWTAVSMAAPVVGAFPQPLVGAGAAPVLGLWIAVGLLAGRLRAQTLEPGEV